MAEKPGNSDSVATVDCANCGEQRTAGGFCQHCGFKPKDEIAADEAKAKAANPSTT